MRVVRWKNVATGVESFTIAATGIYFPVGKTDSSFKLKLSMASAGQTADVDTVRDSTGSRTGYGAMNVSGITETKLGAVVSFATGIVVTAISGTLNAILDDEIAITSWPEVSLGRFPAIEDLVAYCYGSVPALGLLASVAGVQYAYGGVGVGWVGAGTTPPTFPTYEALNAAMPAGVRGRCASVKQISGPGDFKLYDTGARWAVFPGEAPVCDTVETTINADAGMLGVYQTLGSYVIPAGLIGDGEVWEWCDAAMQSAGTAAATVGVVIGASTFLSAVSFATASAAMMRGWRRLRRRGSGLLRMYSTSAAELNAAGTLANFTVAADFSQAQTLAYRVAPSSVTDIITAYNFAIRRAV